MSMRRALAPLVLSVLAGAPGRDEIAFRVAPDTTLERSLESSYWMRLGSLSSALNGQELAMDAEGIDIQIEHREVYRVTDVVGAVAAGRPLTLRRTFDELGGRESSRFSSGDGDASDAKDYASALAGKTVVFTWNHAEERFDAAFAEGAAGDPALLAGLEEDMDLRQLLPAGERATGESWSIDPRAFAAILDPGGDLGLEVPGGGADTSVQDAELRANLAGTITATLVEVRSVEGVRHARIALELDVHTHTATPLGPEDVGEESHGTRRTEVRFRLAGELTWDLEHGHALAFELSGANELESVETVQSTLEGESLTHVQRMALAGEARYAMNVVRR